MRIKKLTLVSASLLMSFGFLAGCSKNEDDKPTSSTSQTTSGEPAPVDTDRGTLTKLEIAAGFKMSYEKTETIPWSSLKLVGLFKKEGSNLLEQYEFTGSQIAFDIDSAASLPAGAEVVVYTQGLHAQSTPIIEGFYNLEAAPVEALTSRFALGKINVGVPTPDQYEMFLFSEPENILTYRANIGKDPTIEGSFYKTTDLLTVGNLNVFKYEPEGMFIDLSEPDADPVVLTNYRKQYSLKKIEGTVKSAVAFSDYAEVVQGGVKFKDAAVGKKFELSCRPTEFAVLPVSVDIEVAAGLNIYSAKELGALNLTRFTKEDFADPSCAHRYAYHYGADGDFDNDCRPVYWDDVNHFVHKDTTALWKSWLVERGVFTAEQETAYQDAPGIFLQNDVTVGKSDIPSDYFISGKEGQTVDTDEDGVYDVDGCLRDYVDIYKPIVHENDVVINGNYFALDSDLGPTRSRGGDDTIYYDDGYTVPNGDFQPGHSSLIKFCGLLPATSWNIYYKNKVDLVNGHKGVLKNLGSNGHVSNQYLPIPQQQPGESESEYAARLERVDQINTIMSITGLIFVKNAFCGADYTNLVIKHYQIGLFPDDMVTGTREHAGAHGEGTINFNTLIADTRVYDCSNCGICNYQNGGVVVEHSDLKRFGGSSLVNMGYKASEDQHTGSEAVPYDNRRCVTYYMDDVITQNYIDGTETYFKTVFADTLFTMLNMYASFFGEIMNTFRDDSKYNLLGLNFDGSALASHNPDFYADFVLDFNKANGEGYLDSSCEDNYWFDIYHNKLPEANIQVVAREFVLPVIMENYGLDEATAWPIALSQAEAMGPQTTPLFVTDKGECFTSLYNTDTASCKLHKVEIAAGDDGKMGTSDDVVTVNTAHMTSADQLQGSKMVLFLPADPTTCIAVFELKKL